MKRYINILAVDDDPNMHRLMELYLASAAFRVTTVSSARMALHKLQHGTYDVLISDIQMPQMDGLDLARAIRARQMAIPIIVVSAFGGSSMVQQARDAGANLVIEKPFEQEDLIKKIDLVLTEAGHAFQ